MHTARTRAVIAVLAPAVIGAGIALAQGRPTPEPALPSAATLLTIGTPVPWTPAWRQRFEAVKTLAEAGGDVPSRSKQCIPSWSGGLGPGIGNGLFEILPTPGQVTVTTENGTVRRIFTDGRRHPPASELDDSIHGHSVGHWENGTLVVDTVGLDPGNEITYGIPGGRGMHVVTRTRLIDPDMLEHIAVLEAPEALTEPRVTRSTFVRETRWEMHEQLCVENNQHFVAPDGTQQFDLTPPDKRQVQGRPS